MRVQHNDPRDDNAAIRAVATNQADELVSAHALSTSLDERVTCRSEFGALRLTPWGDGFALRIVAAQRPFPYRTTASDDMSEWEMRLAPGTTLRTGTHRLVRVPMHVVPMREFGQFSGNAWVHEIDATPI